MDRLTGFAELELDEEGTRISLTIVDTPGFGDQVDNEARLVAPFHSVVECLGALTRLPQLLRDRRLPRETIRRHSRRGVPYQA